jgi:outer membrane protein assembly factor BamB
MPPCAQFRRKATFAGLLCALLWSAATGNAIYSAPVVANGVVYIGSADDNLYAYNAATGALLWSATTGSVVRSTAMANGVVYVGSQDGKLYAYALNAGNNPIYKRDTQPPSLWLLHPDWRLKPAASSPAHPDSER